MRRSIPPPPSKRTPLGAASMTGWGAAPYPTPREGTPLRLAFVGQTTFFAACALEEHSRRVQTLFVEYRAGGDAEAMLARLRGF